MVVVTSPGIEMRRHCAGPSSGDVANRGDDIELAHAEGGDDDGDEGEQDADARGDDDAAWLDVLGEVEAEGSEGGVQDGNHAERDEDSRGGPNDGRPEVVGEPLREEGLHQVAALHSHGAGDAHLRLPLLREHHEDEEDEQDARDDGE